MQIPSAPKKRIGKSRPVKDLSLVFGFGLTVLFLAACLIFMPVRYETNDELANIQRLVAQGNIAPEATSPVLSQTLGYILVGLYKAAPTVPWYGIILYTALLLGISLITTVFIRHSGRLFSFLFYPLFLLYIFHCFSLVSFTAAALTAQLGAFLALLEWTATEKAPAKNQSIYATVLTISLLLGYMLRWELALYFMAFAFPVFLFAKKEHLKPAWPYILALIAFIAADRAMTYYSSTPQEKEYLVYNELRRVFHDTEKGEYHKGITEAALEKTGWTVNDWLMFKRWNLYDETKFNTETLQLFLKENNPGPSKLDLNRIPKKLKESFLRSKNYTSTFLCTVFAILLFKFIAIRQYSRQQLIKAGLAAGFVFSMILFFAYYRFSPRIFVPLYIFSIGLVFLMANLVPLGNNQKNNHRRSFQAGLSLIAGLLLIFAFKTGCTQASGIYRTLKISFQEKTIIQAYFNEVRKRMPELDSVIIYMNPTDALGREYAHPLKELSDINNGLFFMPTGTSVNSPRYNRVLKSLGVQSGREFLEWSIDNPRVLFVIIARDIPFYFDTLRLWETYYNSRVSPEKKVRLKPFLDFRGKGKTGIVLYRMTSSS